MRILTAFLLGLALATSSHAGQERILTKLPPFSLDVRGVGETPPKLIDSVKTVAEQRLKRAGFKLAPTAWKTPSLSIDVSLDDPPDARGVMDFMVGIALYEFTFLQRLPEEFFTTKTWLAGQGGVGDRHAVEAATEVLLQKFIDDYYAVNPRPAPTP